MTFKLGDRVFWRSPADGTRVAVGTIESVNMSSGSTPYGIRTSRGARINVTSGSISATDMPFAKTLVVGDHTAQYFKVAQEISVTAIEGRTDLLEKCDLVMFTGGEDITPAFYKETPHPKTFYNPARDAHEARIWHEAKRLGIPCVGICRGGQFLNVMNGGRMVQHISNHTSPHEMITYSGRKIKVSSTHHQLMDPAEGAQLIAYAEGLSDVYEGLSDYQPCTENDTILEPEVLLYETTKDLCVQYHPEIMGEDTDGRKYFRELVKLL